MLIIYLLNIVSNYIQRYSLKISRNSNMIDDIEFCNYFRVTITLILMSYVDRIYFTFIIHHLSFKCFIINRIINNKENK